MNEEVWSTGDMFRLAGFGVLLVVLLLALFPRSRAWVRRKGGPIARQVLGWALILLGIAGVILPILQGIIFLALGVLVLGPRNPVIRWVRIRTYLLLRAWSARDGLRGWLGGHGLRAFWLWRRQIRAVLHRFGHRLHIPHHHKRPHEPEHTSRS